MDVNKDFAVLDDREHAYNISNMHVGSDKKREKQEYLFVDDKIVLDKIDTPEAVLQIFKEVLSNAGDNIPRSIQYNHKPGKEIIVTINNNTITIRNGGIPIPVEKREKEGKYLPELIFGSFRSSSNYDKTKKRQGAGRNGFGVKEVNVFSKFFKITIGDKLNKLKYEQEWTENMKNCSKPKIEKYIKGSSFVEITYTLDFPRFEMANYDDKTLAQFKYQSAHLAFHYKTRVLFNEKLLYYPDDKDFGKLLFFSNMVVEEKEEEDKEYEINDKKPDNKEGEKDNKIITFENSGVRVILADTPDKGIILSSVNGIPTPDGGAHVDYIIERVFEPFVKQAKEEYIKKNPDANNASVSRTFKVNKVLHHVSIFIDCNVDDPDWGAGQTKSKLNTFTSTIRVPLSINSTLMTWQFSKELSAMVEFKLQEILSDLNGRISSNVDLGKSGYVPAGLAGKKGREKTTLIIVEGKSASQYPKEMLKYIEGGRKYIGIFPIKGKLLNTRKATATKMLKNKEVSNLYKILGLINGKVYTNVGQLNYGKVMILADNDTDGDHIKGLIYDFFFYHWPSLIELGYLEIKLTPLRIATKGKKIIPFYYLEHYEKWKNGEKGDNTGFTVEYYKGLATSNRQDVKRDEVDHPHYLSLINDDLASYHMRLMFATQMEDKRKEMIANRSDEFLPQKKKVPISTFVTTQLVNFAVDAMVRAVPLAVDGLKPSQRKAIWAAIKKFGYKKGTKVSVENFGNFAAEKTHYHQGPKSLQDTVIKMTQAFVGANNLPYFTEDGLSGSRDEGGKDAGAARYVKTNLTNYFGLIFRPEDEPILQLLEEEGSEIEPLYMLPIIPMLLVNGALGIGVGWATFWPCYKDKGVGSVIEWLKNKLRDKPNFNLVPWYKGFKGTIQIEERQVEVKKDKKQDKTGTEQNGVINGEQKKGRRKKVVTEAHLPVFVNEDESEESDDEEEGETKEGKELQKEEVLVTATTRHAMVTTGCFEKDEDDNFHITELPIGCWTMDYRENVKKFRADKIITEYEDNCNGPDVVDFTLVTAKKLDHSKLRLVKSYGMGNMVALSDEHRPIKFKDANELIEYFYNFRLPHYETRKQYQLKEMEKTITVLEEKVKLLRLIDEGKIQVVKRSLKQMTEDMEKNGINPKLITDGSGLKIKDISTDMIDEYKDKMTKLKEEYNVLKKTDIKDIWYRELEQLEQAI
jgi:DNA topoisomerase-2